MQTHHRGWIKQLDDDAAQVNGCGAAKQLLQQLAPGISGGLPLQQALIDSVKNSREVKPLDGGWGAAGVEDEHTHELRITWPGG